MHVSGSNSRNILLIFFVVLSVLLFRRYDAFFTPQLWAEDGPIFVQQYAENGIRSLLIPYGGYLNSAQRLIVLFYGAISLDYIYIPLFYVISCILIIFFIAVRLWKTANYLGLNNKIIYATFFLFTPITSDVFLNITNLNGILSLYLINFLFVRRDEDDKMIIANIILIFITALSGPTSVFLCPIVIIILFKERKRLNLTKLLPLLVILLCGLTQLIFIKFIDKNFARGIAGDPEPFHLLKLFTNNIHDLIFLQYGFLPPISPFKETIICFIIFCFLAFFFIRGYIKINNDRKYIILLAAIFYMGSVVYSYWPNESKLLAMQNASRYFLVPYACLGWLMILAFDKKIRTEYVAIYITFLLLQSKYIKFSLQDKEWKKEIIEYKEGKRQIIDINPEGWKFGLPPKN
jgi:hypothetical protein